MQWPTPPTSKPSRRVPPAETGDAALVSLREEPLEELAKLREDVQQLRNEVAIKLETEALNRERDELQLLLSEKKMGAEEAWATKRKRALQSAAFAEKDEEDLFIKRADMKARNKLYEELVELADLGAQRAWAARWTDPCCLRWGGCRPLLCRGKCKKIVDLFSAAPRDFESTAASADTTVNTLTLVCSLIMTIPYGLMGSTQAGAWDAVEKSIASCMGCVTTESGAPWKWACPPGVVLNAGWSGSVEDILSWRFFRVSNALLFTMYSALATIVLAVIWYVTRPNGHSGAQPRDRLHFRTWWFRGRFLLFCICLFSLLSIISVR